VLNNGEIVNSRLSDFFKYTHYRIVWKAGISLSSERGKVGITLTSPSFSLKGTGEREIVDSYSGLDVDSDGTPEQFLAADYQDNVGANYKAPVSVGIGYSLKLDGRSLHLSAEWYRRIPAYNVIHVTEAENQTTGEPVDNQLSGGTEGVLNFAIGVEQDFGKRFMGFASVATDFSAVEDDTESSLSVTKWDLFHVTTGTRFSYRKADLTLGLGYVFGDEESPRPNSLIDINESNRLFGRTASTDLRYQRLQFIVGLSVST
jgi:long-subunit fatty acid transport protein